MKIGEFSRSDTNVCEMPIPASATASVSLAERLQADWPEPSGYELARGAGALRFWDNDGEYPYEEERT